MLQHKLGILLLSRMLVCHKGEIRSHANKSLGLLTLLLQSLPLLAELAFCDKRQGPELSARELILLFRQSSVDCSCYGCISCFPLGPRHLVLALQNGCGRLCSLHPLFLQCMPPQGAPGGPRLPALLEPVPVCLTVQPDMACTVVLCLYFLSADREET